ncbi:hypothetical protein RV13_GL000854 [Enterococcus raffinosus]|nr:hypothetical protein RV13_GL000854 [Enterococcus raffinosus]
MISRLAGKRKRTLENQKNDYRGFFFFHMTHHYFYPEDTA